MSQLEVKKMKKGMAYSCKEKTIILNVFKYFRQKFPDKSVSDLVRQSAQATGCSEQSIYRFRKEEASPEGFKDPSKTRPKRNPNANSRAIKFDDNVRQSVRNIVYGLKYRNIVPSLKTIVKHVNADEQLPNLSVMTLRRLLFDMGFCYEKDGKKSILVEKEQKNVNTKTISKKTNKKKILKSCGKHGNTSNNNEHLNDSGNMPNETMPHENISVLNHMHQVNGYLDFEYKMEDSSKNFTYLGQPC